MGRLKIPTKLRRLAIDNLDEEATKQIIDGVQHEMYNVDEKDRERVMKQRIISRLKDALNIKKKPSKKNVKNAIKKEAKIKLENKTEKVKKSPPKTPIIMYDKDPYATRLSDYIQKFKQKHASC